ncbi:MAG: tellurium resistance protein TerC [Chryseobacterium sp.]|nr:tellurium resistance protein TerC [Chryseobacterium sp.]
MKTFRTRFIEFVSYFFILLFCYASISKMMDFENFQIQIAQSPLLSAFSNVMSYGVLVIELAICILLIFERSRKIGLYSSFVLMVSFTVYIYMILNYSEFIPCSCGGILEKMDWKTHLIFNIATVIIAAFAVILYSDSKRQEIFKSVSLLLVLSIVSCSAIILMYRQSEFMIKKENNFTRRFLQHPITEEKRSNLQINSYYFAGISKDSVYLGNYTAPFLLTSTDLNFKATKENRVLPDRYNFDFKRVQLKVNAQNYYLYDGSVPVIYQGILGNHQAKTLSLGQAYFSQLVNISKDAFAISTYFKDSEKQTLGLLNPLQKNPLNLKSGILGKTNDGIFDTDGQLHFDPLTQIAVYVHYYKNQLLIMDDHLTVKAKYKTIDTISIPQIKVSELSDGKKKMSKPPLKVNKKAFVYAGLLFIESNLIGKFEDRDRWKNSFIIDVYSTVKQGYIGSFYLPNPKKEKKVQFHITDQLLYVLTGNEIIKYRFAQNITQHFIAGEAENLNQE